MQIYYWKNSKWLLVEHNGLPAKDDFEKDYVKLPITIPYDKTIDAESNLGIAFGILNDAYQYTPNPMSQPIHQQWIRDNLKPHPHTSMSVGDIIKIEDEYWIAKGVGWEKLKW